MMAATAWAAPRVPIDAEAASETGQWATRSAHEATA
jgi:hypothetical protein